MAVPLFGLVEHLLLQAGLLFLELSLFPFKLFLESLFLELVAAGTIVFEVSHDASVIAGMDVALEALDLQNLRHLLIQYLTALLGEHLFVPLEPLWAPHAPATLSELTQVQAEDVVDLALYS